MNVLPQPIVVTGARGQLGRAFCQLLGPQAIGLTRAELNLAEPELVAERLRALRPAAVIHCAAYTQVDRAESDAALCYRVNAQAVEALAQVCNEWGATLLQISTDYVFAGSARGAGPFTEEDQPEPRGVYASSKLAGEVAARGCRNHLIVRTCGLYGPPGPNFVETMLRLGTQRGQVRVVGDQHCTPSYAAHVARAAAFLLASGERGLFHVVNHGATTWHDFAAEIFRQAGLAVRLERISTAEYNAPAPRPAYSVLSTSRYDRLGGPALPEWQTALAEYLATRK